MKEILIPILTMGVLGFVLSYGLTLATKKLRVEVDPRVEKIAEVLPNANCGGCGFAGCGAFAEAVALGKAPAGGCPVGGSSVAEAVAAILGVEAGPTVKKTARVHCRGTREAALPRGEYGGVGTCYASHLMGGNKQCSFGCMGFGDCVRACPFNAMAMNSEGLPVIDENKCTACGKCVEACPRGIIELHPEDQDVLVFCRSLDRPQVSRKVCQNACIACNICVRAFPEAIVLENNLAVIKEYRKIDKLRLAELKKCPTAAIGLLKKEHAG